MYVFLALTVPKMTMISDEEHSFWSEILYFEISLQCKLNEVSIPPSGEWMWNDDGTWRHDLPECRVSQIGFSALKHACSHIGFIPLILLSFC